MNLTNLSQTKEIRADGDQGIIEGYVAVWNTVDSYNSRFQRGAFKKTIQNRTDKIKVLYNHDIKQPIGKLLDIKEDNHGLFIRAQLITDVEKAKDTLSLIKGGAINCFSFGFRTIKQHFEKGVQVITEVMLGEVSPVVFESNSASKIISVRTEDFSETDEFRELQDRGPRLFRSLDETLLDIMWGSFDNKLELVSNAINDFNTAYLLWVQEIIDIQSGGVRMAIPTNNELSDAFNDYSKEKSIETIAKETVFTVEELRNLKKGQFINGKDLSVLSQEIKNAHDSVRSKAVFTLCDELRAGINPAEAIRIDTLLQKSLPVEADEAIAYMSEFRKKLIGEIK